MENSDGCSAAVLERMVVDPRGNRRYTGAGTLAPWMDVARSEVPLPLPDDMKVTPKGEGTYPVFELGSWRFTVKTRDLPLIEELGAFAREIAGLPRADVKFTFRLVTCTEEGKLGGWAWQKERAKDL
jgi:hypothetical protein